MRSTCSTGAVESVPVKAMPALAIATSMPPKRSTVAATAPSSAPMSVDVGLEPGRALAEALGVLAQPLGLEPDERDVRAACVQALGGCRADAACRARDEDRLASHVRSPFVSRGV